MIINMAHGSGGKATSELIGNVFAKHFSNDILSKMEDAAVFDISGKVAYTTDSFVVTPIFYKGGDIGYLSVCGTVNDLLMMGAEPRYITAAFIIEQGADDETLDRIAASMAKAAKEAGVKIVAGDTKVIEGKGGVYINTSGIGVIPEGREISASRCGEGDAIIVSGTLGDHHACIISSRMGIENDIASDNMPLNSLVNVLFDNGIHIKAMRDITRGGLATVLNEICDSSKCGANINESRLPVKPQVKGLCDILGLDPLYMGNEGKFLAVVEKADAEKAIQKLQDTKLGENAVVIGEMVKGKGVTMVTSFKTLRQINVLYGEGLPRIC